MFIAKFVLGFVTILPAAPLTYSSLLASYVIVISAVLIPPDGTFAKLTGITTCSPTFPLTESTLTVKPVDGCVVDCGDGAAVCCVGGVVGCAGFPVFADEELTEKLLGSVFVPLYDILKPIVTDPPAGIDAL